MEQISLHVMRRFVDMYRITDQEAIGLARYLLWLQLDLSD